MSSKKTLPKNLSKSKVFSLFQALRALDPSPNQPGPDTKNTGRFIFDDASVVYKIARNLAILEPIIAAIESSRLTVVKKYLAPNETQLQPGTEAYDKFMDEWAGQTGYLSVPIGEDISLFTISFSDLSMKSRKNMDGNDIPTPVLVSLDPILTDPDTDK